MLWTRSAVHKEVNRTIKRRKVYSTLTFTSRILKIIVLSTELMGRGCIGSACGFESPSPPRENVKSPAYSVEGARVA